MLVRESYNVYDPLMIASMKWEKSGKITAQTTSSKTWRRHHHNLYELFMAENYDADVYLMLIWKADLMNGTVKLQMVDRYIN